MNNQVHVHTLNVGVGVQKQGGGHQTGKQKVQEGRQGLEEDEEEEEKGREKQVGLVDFRVRASLGVWEEEWGTLCCRGDEEEGQAGSGVQW